MSVLIMGMGMPKSCSVCPMLEGDRMDGLCHAASKWLDDDEHWTWYVYPEGDMDDSKPCNCPLVTVPEHGRLIDADAFEDFIRKDRGKDDHWIANVVYSRPCVGRSQKKFQAEEEAVKAWNKRE